MLDTLVRWARRKSPLILSFNSGGCNGYDIEILQLLTPRYDVERLGILKEASPHHADVLLCSRITPGLFVKGRLSTKLFKNSALGVLDLLVKDLRS